MKFYKEVKRILEDYNVYPRAKAIQGRQAPVPSKNVNFQGVTPTGFLGSGPTGIAPSSMSPVLVKFHKKKKKIKKKKDSSS
jgi:hypothetical protein